MLFVAPVASDVEVLARFGRALADPIRCRLLLALREAPAYPSDLADALAVSRTRLSNHLACLRDCGLVIAVPDGRRVRYEPHVHGRGHQGLLSMTAVSLGPSPARRDVLARRIRLLVAATITWNVAEATVAITAGTISSSAALLGFGLDSVVEVCSAAAVAWQFSARDHDVREAREKTTLRIIALSFFALAAYVTADSAHALAGGSEAGHSLPGIVLAALSLLVMPLLSAAQRRAGRELGSGTAVADSKQTLLCTYLSAVLLAGLLLNAGLGWSWADPAAALVIAALAVREGREAWRGEGCCAVSPAASSALPASRASGCGCAPGCGCRD